MRALGSEIRHLVHLQGDQLLDMGIQAARELEGVVMLVLPALAANVQKLHGLRPSGAHELDVAGAAVRVVALAAERELCAPLGFAVNTVAATCGVVEPENGGNE